MIGQTVSHYRIIEDLGGCFGRAYKAEDTTQHRVVVLKFMPQEVASNRQALEHFHHEYRVLSGLNHQNIGGCYDIGNHEGHPFKVIEFLEGATLNAKLAGKPFKIDELVEIAIQVADGLGAIHSKNIVHRDIKPANIFVTYHWQVKILDFSLAKLASGNKADNINDVYPKNAVEDEEDELERCGEVLGNPSYMAPEMIRGDEVDHRADLFSLGLVLYEMATGRRPYGADSVIELFEAILKAPVVSPQRVNPKLPHELDRIICKALQKDPHSRYQSATEMRDDLLRLRRDMESPNDMPPSKRSSWLGRVRRFLGAPFHLYGPTRTH